MKTRQIEIEIPVLPLLVAFLLTLAAGTMTVSFIFAGGTQQCTEQAKSRP